MIKYTTFGQFQNEQNSYVERTGMRLQFMEMIHRMDQKGLLSTRPTPIRISEEFLAVSDDEFDKIVDTFPIEVFLNSSTDSEIAEEKIIPKLSDVFTFRHPKLTRKFLHKHNYFELNFVVKGECTFFFENNEYVMHEGELCIIAPNSSHELIIDDTNSIIHTICIRKSTFDSTFSTIMSNQNLLSNFFKQSLRDDTTPNYLMFFTGNNMECRIFLRKLIIESFYDNSFSNSCSINLINLLFANLLRNYSKTIAFYNYELGNDFSLVLQYIQHNYQNLTLASLAEFFHYSEPHLCTLLKQNTGYSFTELIRNLRMKEAVDYLINSDLQINEIAEHVGYNSADHFSRVFRKVYNCSPATYRKENKKESPFIPFSCRQ